MYEHELLKLLESKFTSGNDVPVTRATITRAEYGAIRHLLQSQEQAGGGETPEQLAVRFHETYERLAPFFGYITRKETRQFDPESANGRLMIAVCAELLSAPAPEGEAIREHNRRFVQGLSAVKQWANEESDALEKARQIASADPNTSYPSRASANNIRSAVAALLKKYDDIRLDVVEANRRYEAAANEIDRLERELSALRTAEDGWVLPRSSVNDLQASSIDDLIRICKRAHFANVRVRINGLWEEHEADWIKHMRPSEAAPNPLSATERKEG